MNYVQIDATRANTTSYRNSGLLSRRTYRYRVHAYNFNSAYSNIARAQTKWRPAPSGSGKTGSEVGFEPSRTGTISA